MSISNLFNENNYNLNCGNLNVKGKFKSKIIEVEEYIIDNITVNTAIVNNSITTPHINSGTTTFNTVGTINLGSVNGEIENGNIVNFTSNDAEIAGLDVTGLSTLNDVTINGTLTVAGSSLVIDNITVSDTLQAANAEIVNLDVTGTLTAGTFNPSTIVCDDLTVGNLSLLNNVTVTGTLISGPFNPSSLSTPNINVDSISPFSGANIGLNGPVIGSNITLSSSLTSPLTKTNQIDTTTGAGILVVVRPTVFNLNVTVGGSIAAGTATLTSLVGSIMNYGSGTITSLSTDIIRTISGSGNVTFNSPLIFTAAPGYIQEPININAKQSQTTPVSGGATTTPTNVTLQYCRSGSQVLINVPDGTFTSSGVVGILILTPPAPWSFPSAFAAGTCILNYAGINYQINYRYVSASNQFQFTANNESNLLNSGVGCPVVPAATTFQIRGFTISLIV